MQKSSDPGADSGLLVRAILVQKSSAPRASCLAFFTSQKILIAIVRVTAPKTIRLASSKLAFYCKVDELRPVPVAVIAGLHQGINGGHGLGFDRNDKADRFSKLAGISAHKCGSLW